MQTRSDPQIWHFFRAHMESTCLKATSFLFLPPFPTPSNILLKARENTAASTEQEPIYRDAQRTRLKIGILFPLFLGNISSSRVNSCLVHHLKVSWYPTGGWVQAAVRPPWSLPQPLLTGQCYGPQPSWRPAAWLPPVYPHLVAGRVRWGLKIRHNALGLV